MLLPAAFGSIEDSYHHLKKNVQVWDVAGERQVEIIGNDAAKLVQLMTCRDLSKSRDGRCYYCPVIDDKGGLINDEGFFKEKFIDKESNNIRENIHNFYIPSIDEILHIISRVGFKYITNIDMSKCNYNYQYLYIFKKP